MVKESRTSLGARAAKRLAFFAMGSILATALAGSVILSSRNGHALRTCALRLGAFGPSKAVAYERCYRDAGGVGTVTGFTVLQ